MKKLSTAVIIVLIASTVAFGQSIPKAGDVAVCTTANFATRSLDELSLYVDLADTHDSDAMVKMAREGRLVLIAVGDTIFVKEVAAQKHTIVNFRKKGTLDDLWAYWSINREAGLEYFFKTK